MATGIHEREMELVQAAERGDVATVKRLTKELHVNPDCEWVCNRSIRYAIDTNTEGVLKRKRDLDSQSYWQGKEAEAESTD